MSEDPQPFALPDDADQRDNLARLGQLTAGLVHELKNPLGAIRLNADLVLDQMRKEPLDHERARKRVQRIVRGSVELDKIISTFLSFVRPGRPDPDRVDVNQILEELIESQREIFELHDIDVAFRPAKDLPAVPADPAQLRVVFLNIVVNGCDALMERDEDRRLIIVTRAAQHAARVVIANNGPELSKSAAAHLFDPFYSDKEGGTGLGLAIVRRLVELHHGHVAVSSSAERGVSFTIELPTSLGPAQKRTGLPAPQPLTPSSSDPSDHAHDGSPLP